MSLNKIIKNIENEENEFLQHKNVKNMGLKYFYNKMVLWSDSNILFTIFLLSSLSLFLVTYMGFLIYDKILLQYIGSSLLLLMLVFLSPALVSFSSLFLFDKIYYKIKFKKVKNKQDQNILLKKAFSWEFYNKKISDDIANQLKIGLTQEDYKNLMLNYKNLDGFITYNKLKTFLDKQIKIQDILDEQINVTLSEVKIKELIN